LRVTKKSVKKPDETRIFPKGRLEVVSVSGFTIGRATYQPGWKWSKHVKPIVGTETCQAHHVGYAISGRLAGTSEDGSKWEIGPGDVVDIPPGHDAWVVGKTPVVLVDFMGAFNYAKPR
jgi:quercetin dioxygenase-like cupin family protein